MGISLLVLVVMETRPILLAPITRVDSTIGPVTCYQTLSEREIQLVESAFKVLGKHPPRYVFWLGEIYENAGYFRGERFDPSPGKALKLGDMLRFEKPEVFGVYLGHLRFKGKEYKRAGIWQSKVGPVLREFPEKQRLIRIWRADDH